MPSFYAQFDFLPENKLFFKTAYSQDINVIQTRAYTPEYLVGGTQLNSTSLNKKNDIYHSWILDNTLTYTDTFGDHGLTAMLVNPYVKRTGVTYGEKLQVFRADTRNITI